MYSNASASASFSCGFVMPWLFQAFAARLPRIEPPVAAEKPCAVRCDEGDDVGIARLQEGEGQPFVQFGNGLSDESFGKTLNSQIFPGIQGGPLMHIVAAKAVAFGEALRPRFKDYQAQVLRNTVTLGEELKNAKFNLVSGGTDNHLLLVDLTSKDITGKDAEHALDAAGITVNKNTVPFETRSPFVTSGIRIGTPALTTRGFREQDMVKVAGWIDAAIANAGNETRLAEISKEVAVFARQFPLFAW